MTAVDAEPLLYNARQAAQRLGKDEETGRPLISAFWLERQAAARAIPCTYIGRKLVFSEANLLELVAGGYCDPKTGGRKRR
jgi:hypothetical protein